jgi:transglutaminase-like putative cysteine protease
MPAIDLDITVRVGCHFAYQAAFPIPTLLIVRPMLDEHHYVIQDRLSCSPWIPSGDYMDGQGNQVLRWSMQPGLNVVHYDALVAVSSLPDPMPQNPYFVPIEQLPPWAFRYTLPSRYCDSDRVLGFAAAEFGRYPAGLQQVIAICNWVHFNIEYRFGAGRSDTCASEVLANRYGVCRDFAHVAITLCRAMNIPARYVFGYLPAIGLVDSPTPMDFHAYFEAFLGHEWVTFDARFNERRIGRIKVAHGLDAVDTAFATMYGNSVMSWFEVWTYQVSPYTVNVGDPVDLSKRIDSSPIVRKS